MKKQLFIFLFIGLSTNSYLLAQCITISGSSNCIGSMATYVKGSNTRFAHTGSIFGGAFWEIVGGTPTSCNRCSTVFVNWSSTASSGSVILKDITGQVLDAISINLVSSLPPPPPLLLPKAPTVSNLSTCGSNVVVTFNATPGAGETTTITGYKWYKPNGAYAQTTSGSYTTNPLDYPSASGATYQVSAVNSRGEGPKSYVSVTTNGKPSLPNAPNKSRCGNGTVTLTASLSGVSTFRWYTQSSGGSVWKTGSSIVTPILAASRSYWVSAVNAEGCEGNRKQVNVSIVPPATATISKTQDAVCGTGASGVLSFSGTTSAFVQWEIYQSGSWMKYGSDNFPPETISYIEKPNGTRFRAKLNQSTCGVTYSNEAVISLVPGSIGGEAGVGDPLACSNQTVTLSVYNHSGTVLRWEKRIPGFSWAPIASSQANPLNYQMGTQPLEFRAVVKDGTCPEKTSSSVLVQVATLQLPNAPNKSRCGNGTVTLTASLSGVSTFRWYTQSSGGSIWKTGSSVVTPILAAPRSYWVSAVNAAGCEGNRKQVNVSIVPPATATISKTQDAVCGTGASGVLSFSGTTSAFVQWEIYHSGSWMKYGSDNFPPETISYIEKPNGTRFRAKLNQSTCGVTYSNEAVISLVPGSIGGEAGVGDPLACSNQTITLSVYNHSGEVIRWEKRYPEFSWEPIASSQANPLNYQMGTQPLEFRAVVKDGTCPEKTSSSVLVQVNPVITPYELTGSANIYPGYQTATINLSSSQANVTYSLYKGGVNQGQPKVGTGSALLWNSISDEGTYTVMAEQNSCLKQMNGSIVINHNSLPVVQIFNDTLFVPILRNEPLVLNDYAEVFGSWSGTGVQSNQFITKNAGAGIHVVKYRKYYDFGYTFEKDMVIVVEYKLNHVKIASFRDKEIQLPIEEDDLSPEQVSITTDYIDGIGRTMQRVNKGGSPNKRDMVKPMEYDALGRINKEYLPYAANKNDGVLDPSALRTTGGSYETSNQFGFYDGTESNVAATDYPYAEITYESSPLNRPVAQYAPGEDWAKDNGTGGKAVTTEYLISTTADNVKRFKIVNGQLTKNAHYGNGAFEKLLITDENDNQSATFTDAFGKVLLKRNYGDNGDQFDTYYVYDIYDNLRFVIPPEASQQITGTSGAVDTGLMEQFAFQYKYDGRQRMTWKKVPGADSVIMIYDDRDRLVLTQDGEQRENSVFSFTKYDALNRPIMTGETIITTPVTTIRSSLTGAGWTSDPYETKGGNLFGYTNNSYPSVSEADIYTVTYYDNYDFRPAAGMDAATYNYAANGVANEFAQTHLVKGLATGNLTRILGTAEMLGSINYYDERYRLVQNISEQPDGKFIIANSSYDFVGNLKKAKSIYSIGADTQTITETFTHDHADRLLEVHHEVSKPVNWQNVIGYSVDVHNNLTHAGAASYGNTSAHTEVSIDKESNGFIEMQPQMSARMLFGFNDAPQGTNYVDMEYCLYTTPTNGLVVYELGQNIRSVGSYAFGDVLRVEKIGSRVYYKKNGETLYVSTKLVNKPLFGDVTSYNVGDKISNVTFSNSGTVLMVFNEYNEVGELITKNLHTEGTQEGFAQSVDYRYNIRGWLERINHADLSADHANEAPDLFGMELGYTDNFGMGSVAQYNGNIAAVKWGSKRNDMSVAETVLQNAYGYAYDPLNRITEANYFEGPGQNTSQKYQLSISLYDMNGNIKLLQRRDETGALMDNLTYNYANNGNRLNYVTDAGNIEKGFKDGNTSGNDYTYDDNGNMITDANKEITTIAYNYLNLPKEVIFAGNKQIKYIYDASGKKHRQEVYENNTLIKTTDYIGAMIVENDTLQFIQTAEGRVVPKTVDGQAKLEYQYHLTDQLGNVRTTFAVRDDEYPTDFEAVNNPYFDNYDQITILPHLLKRSGNSAHRLLGGQAITSGGSGPPGPPGGDPDLDPVMSAEYVGLMKSLYVSKGDKVSAEVYGKYIAATNQDDAINTGALITALVNMLSGGAVSGEAALTSENLTGFSSAAIADNSNEQSPRAYLNYIMLDKDFNYLNSGFDRLSTNAADPGDGSGTHQKLSFEEIFIDQDGYLIVFLSNESQQTVEVFWDDFRVDHHHNAVLQASDYFPFGTPFNEYKREYSKENRMNTFQDQEVIKDFDLNWVQFKWRNHDPALGRFFNVDPLAEDYYYNSPYAFSENRVIDGIELEGLEWKSIKDNDNKTVINIVNVKVQNNSKLDNTSAMALIMDVMNEGEKSYSGVDSDGYKVITKATIDFDSPVSEGDFYIELRDNIEMSGNSISNYAYGKVDKIGDTKSNRIQLNARKAENDREGLIKSGVHELGHTAGLTHPNPNSSAPGKDDNGNYLDSKNVMLHNSDNKSVTPQQLKLINDTIENLQNGF